MRWPSADSSLAIAPQLQDDSPNSKNLDTAKYDGVIRHLLICVTLVLFRSGHGTQLLHHAHDVGLAPMFHNLTFGNAEDIDAANRETLVG